MKPANMTFLAIIFALTTGLVLAGRKNHLVPLHLSHCKRHLHLVPPQTVRRSYYGMQPRGVT